MGLDRPRAGAALGLEGSERRRIQPSVEGEIGEPLLRDIGVLVLLVGAVCVQGLDTQDADDAAEEIGLFVVKINQLSGLGFDVLDRLFDLEGGQARR